MHMTCPAVPVFPRIDEEDFSPNARKTAQGAEASRTAANNNGIVVRLHDPVVVLWDRHPKCSSDKAKGQKTG